MCDVAYHANIAFSLPFNSVQTFIFLNLNMAPKGQIVAISFPLFRRAAGNAGASPRGQDYNQKP